MEIARRAGLHIDGVNFPGIPRAQPRRRQAHDERPADRSVPRRALLSEHDCRVLLQKHVGSEIAFSKSLLAPPRARKSSSMLLNLKRIYVHMRSFPQAARSPSCSSRSRRRRSTSCGTGLLNYHSRRHRRAADLQTYLKLSSMSGDGQGSARGARQIWEHVKTLRRRVAALN